MQYHAIQRNTMQYHAIPCNTMQYHAIPCNTLQYNAIPCNTMQYHASLITADGAYHCPVGSIMAIFHFRKVAHFLKRKFPISNCCGQFSKQYCQRGANRNSPLSHFFYKFFIFFRSCNNFLTQT